MENVERNEKPPRVLLAERKSARKNKSYGDQTEGIQRDSTERHVPSRYLSGGVEELRRPPERLRSLLLHRGSARAHDAAGPESTEGQRARDRGHLPRCGPRAFEGCDLPPEQRRRACGTLLAPELRRQGGRALSHDAVQGQDAEGRCRGSERRALRLPRPAGRRHPPIQCPPRTSRRGPAPAPRARPDNRAA